MHASHPAYQKICRLSKKIALLTSMQYLLDWDQETYMPKEGIVLRSEQAELLATLAHKESISSVFQKALGALIDLKSGTLQDTTIPQEQAAALREWRRDLSKTIKLPSAFVRKWAKTTSESMHTWAIAKKEDNFALFAPYLEKIVALNRKKADLLGYTEHPYDALLDLYEPEARVSELRPLFSSLRTSLTALLQEIMTAPQIDDHFLHAYYSPTKQLHFGNTLLTAMGFDEKMSRLDQSSHPFCMPIHPKDVRMTTRIHPDNLMSNIFSVIHEGGHGLYAANRPQEHFGTPLGESCSLGIDESQSRWWETRIGRSYSFWQHFYPLLQAEFPEQLREISLHDFHRAINKAAPSLIRVEADEVTYSLHVIVRFEIEMGLIDGSIRVKQVPEVWNEKMRAYFGISPFNNSVGCLQDIHWSMGAIGYFPTYTLGNLYAAQFFQAFETTHPTWKEEVAKGELAFIREWLKEKIHCHGRRYTPRELVKQITGRPLSEKPFISYLETKYRALYHLS